MSRIRRIFIPGTLYHVFNRGVEKKNIFKTDDDRIKFLTIIENALKQYRFKIYAYVLMPNHYHILLEDEDGNLSKIMKYIGEKYAMYFNWKYKRVGHLYQGRYKCLIVEKEMYLKEVARYIMLNPIRAGLVEKLIHYNWSSYYEYIGKNKRFKLVNTDYILNQFDTNKNKAITLFKKYLIEKDDVTDKIIEESLVNDLVFGTEKFKGKIFESIKNFEDKMKIKILKTNNSKRIEDILNEIKVKFKVSEAELKKKKGKNNYAKKAAIYLIKNRTSCSLEEIGKIFNMHPVSISRELNSIRREIQHNKLFYKQLIDDVKSGVWPQT